MFCCLNIIFSSVQVRLSGSENEAEGTVEIYYNKGWSTVCDQGLSEQFGVLVCNALGYK